MEAGGVEERRGGRPMDAWAEKGRKGEAGGKAFEEMRLDARGPGIEIPRLQWNVAHMK